MSDNTQPKQRLTFEQQSKIRNESLLESGGTNARVIIANTVETKGFASKLVVLDLIARRAREQVGNEVEIEDFKKLSEKFKKIDEAIDEIIKLSEEKNIYRNPRTLKYGYHKDAITKSIDAGKSAKDISEEIKIPLNKVESWIKLIERERSPIQAASEVAVANETTKEEEKETKTKK